MDRTGIIEELQQGRCVLGMELGSTRIKAELIGSDNTPVAEVFASAEGSTLQPDPEDAAGFDRYMERYLAGLAVERAAAEVL